MAGAVAVVALALASAPASAHPLHAQAKPATPTTPDVSPATVGQARAAFGGASLSAQPEALRAAPCEDGMAAIYPCENVDMESFVPLPALGIGSGNDIWGWEDPKTGREYALMGTATATGFVDVTDPKNPVVLGQLPTRGTPDFVLWRDIKVDGNYAFIVSEITGSGLQVFDLTRLRAADDGAPRAPQVFTADATFDGFSYAHNISINEETDTAYVVGSNMCGNGDENGGLYMVDISDPRKPSYAGCAPIADADGNPETESNNYVHDVECVVYDGPDRDYAGREICFGSNEDVVAIYDVTDRDNPVVVSLTGYPSAAYTHQGSLTPDRRYFLFGDELDESTGTVKNTTTYVMDVRDLDAPPTPRPYSHASVSIDHNLYVHGNHVYESNYLEGLRILSYTRGSLAAGQQQLNEIGYFDVVPAVDFPEYGGTWSNYRFDSGTTVVSTIENAVSGMFVLRPTVQPASAPGKSGEHRRDDGRGRGGKPRS